MCLIGLSFIKASLDIDLCNVVWHKYARGTEPLQAEAVILLDNVLTTSIRTVTVDNKTVALIGTSTGNLLKVGFVFILKFISFRYRLAAGRRA